MTDLHFDVKSASLHSEQNKWNVKVTIFIGKGAETEDPLDEDDIIDGYEHIYIPLTLTRCLVIEDGAITQIKCPAYQLSFDNVYYQDIWVGGKDFHLMSMETYWKIKKGKE